LCTRFPCVFFVVLWKIGPSGLSNDPYGRDSPPPPLRWRCHVVTPCFFFFFFNASVLSPKDCGRGPGARAPPRQRTPGHRDLFRTGHWRRAPDFGNGFQRLPSSVRKEPSASAYFLDRRRIVFGRSTKSRSAPPPCRPRTLLEQKPRRGRVHLLDVGCQAVPLVS